MDSRKIYLGAAYYPELWLEEEQKKDIILMKELGINVVRIGEFAWSKMQPREDVFDFEWLKNTLDDLYRNGISTVLCTPTCTPPRWLAKKYPEILSVDSFGVRAELSSRCHPCKTSAIMRRKNAEVVSRLAEAFSSHPGIIGWQIDNEMFPYNEGCFCENCVKGFRDWLQKKYGTTARLNERWGMYRWSLNYDDFSDVTPPREGQWSHPSLRVEWMRYQCENVISYIGEQAEAIRRYSSAPIGTDMMPFNVLSYYQTVKPLDVVQMNHYDAAENLFQSAFSYDFVRTLKKRPFWITETQAGWNGSEYAENGYRPQGNCYANTWLPIAKGGEMNLYWLFREHPNGHEIAHGALAYSDGRPCCFSAEVAHAARDFRLCERFLTRSGIRSRIALHYSSTAAQIFRAAPMLKGFDYRSELVDKFYPAFRHDNLDIIETAAPVDDYEVILSPFLATADENDLKNRMIEWVKKGGVWIVGPMTDIMDEVACKYTRAPHSFLEEVAGIRVKDRLPLNSVEIRARHKSGRVFSISDCFYAFETTEGESLAVYAGGFFDGMSVVSERRIGKGRVIAVGSVLPSAELRALVPCDPIAEASENVTLVERSGEHNGIIAIETEWREGYVCLKGKYTELLSGKEMSGRTEIPPYGVLVLENAV